MVWEIRGNPLFFAQEIISGWWYTYPSEKYESQLGWLFPIYGKIKNVSNHQPDFIDVVFWQFAMETVAQLDVVP